MEAVEAHASAFNYEFNAPMFRDFNVTTPVGEAPDEWFNTSATRGLVSPAELAESSKEASQQPSVEGNKQPSQDTENIFPSGNSAPKSNSSEAEQVRAVLAHITNAAAPKQQQQQSARKATLRNAQANVAPLQEKVKSPPAAVAPQAVRPSRKTPSKPPPAAPAAEPALPKPEWAKPIAAAAFFSGAAPKPAAPRAAAAPKPAVPRAAAPVPPRPTAAASSKPRQAAAAAPKGRPPKAAASARQAPKLTVPHSPMLRSKQRSANSRQQMKTSEQLEMEEVERGKKEAAVMRRRNAARMGAGPSSRPPPAPRQPAAKRTALTAPKEPELRTSKRQRLHTMATRSANDAAPLKPTAQHTAAFAPRGPTAEPKRKRAAPAAGNRRPQLTLPRTPKFATSSRARPARFKPTEEAEAENAAARRNFKARPVNQRVMQGNAAGGRSQPKRAEKKPPTTFAPFSFATDVRAAKRVKPEATLPPPFVFGAGKAGPVTRSRARVVTTSAPEYELEQQHNGEVMMAPEASSEEEAGLSENSPAKARGPGAFLLGKRRRTTAGPMLLGGAVRVPQAEQQQQQVEDDEQHIVEASGQDGMQAIIRAGAGNADPTTLHNPLFRA